MPTGLTKPERRSFRAAVSVLFLDNLGLSVVFPIFTFLVLKPAYDLLPRALPLSIRMTLLGLLIAAFPLMQFLGGPILGHLADQKGRRFAFLLALLGEGVGFALTGLAITMENYPLLVFARLFSGFFAGNFMICLATISDLSHDVKSRCKYFGTVSGIAGIGFVIAIVLGGVLSDTALNRIFNSSLPFWIITAFAFINIGIIRGAFKETKKTPPLKHHYFKEQYRELVRIFKFTDLSFLYPLFFFFMLGWIVSLQFLSSFLIEHFNGTKTMIILIFIAVGSAWCVSNMWLNRLLIRFFSSERILFISLFLTTACLFAASEVHYYILFFHFIVFGAIFASLVWANILALISIKAPFYLQGKLLGINQSVAALSMTLAPFFGGLLGEFDIRVIYLFASISLLISFIIFVVFKNKIKK